ncbi:Flavocytochrome C [Mycena indigotica]|uniref:Fumarate reductase n=1 Tax=Mycena indigotica TaxID=2126181 RepID=A0A8H6S441_9AGAR|nr:Flavocytochrome C [Mycena indigotica]KAF7292072.1 Flavocytochrome C [Mycena indigotica]
MATAGARTIVVGGGLAGLSAAHTLVERGRRVVLLDKWPSLGGNSLKASSGINGAETAAQKALGIDDSVEAFAADTLSSAIPHQHPDLITALTANSPAAISWLTDTFGIDLSVVARLGGHSIARTHRGEGGAPGYAITDALMKRLGEEKKVEIVTHARVTRLLEEEGHIVGVEYRNMAGETVVVRGEGVILATGGYAADLSPDSLIAKHRPDLLSLSTTNGPHATGDGITLATSDSLPASLRAGTTDLSLVQIRQPAFWLRKGCAGAGGMLVDKNGKRFIKEVERRDVVTAAMQTVEKEERGPVRLVMGEKAVAGMAKACAFYVFKGLMKRYDNAKAFADDTGVPLDNVLDTFAQFGTETDPLGSGVDAGMSSISSYLSPLNSPAFTPDEPLHVAITTPVVHYTMGGLSVDASARVLAAESGEPIPGLWAAGEVIGGVHGQNRLAGSSLLEAVVFGRIAGSGPGA